MHRENKLILNGSYLIENVVFLKCSVSFLAKILELHLLDRNSYCIS